MVSPDLPTAASPRLSLQRGDQIYVPLQAELPVMPGSRATRQNVDVSDNGVCSPNGGFHKYGYPKMDGS